MIAERVMRQLGNGKAGSPAQHGRRLLALIEQEGRQRGAKNAYLDTFSFQAPGFYAKLGYRVFGTLTEFPSGHQRCFLTKALE